MNRHLNLIRTIIFCEQIMVWYCYYLIFLRLNPGIKKNSEKKEEYLRTKVFIQDKKP